MPLETLLNLQTVTGISPNAVTLGSRPPRAFHAYGKTSAGAGAAVVDIIAGNTPDPAAAVLLGTISLTLGTTLIGDGFVSDAPWRFVWARVNSISGTGAQVSVSGSSQ